MELDNQQQQAVAATERNVLVVAGPGAGKTRVIVERAAYLIEHQKVSPYELVLVTFTRMAANEIRKRLVERVGNKAYHMTIGTFHATALNLLHRFGELIGFKKVHSTVYGEFEEQYLLRETAADMGILKGKSWKIKKGDIDAVFAKYYQEGIEPDKDNPVHDLFVAFIGRCRENNSYTYGSLLTGLRLLMPHIHKYVHWRHLILDEAHDTDKLQWELLRTMQEYCNTSLYVVADLDQSIYGWRGAYPGYLIEHRHEFTLYKLETNYRSVPAIVEASNRLIVHNQDRIGKTMRAARTGGVDMPTVRTEFDSARLVQMLTIGGPTAAVLSRIHGLLEKIDRLMTDKGIPHVYIGKEAALTNSEAFRRFHAFLKLLCNPYDNFSFLLIRDLIGLSREEYSRLRILAAEDGISHFQAWTAYSDETNYMKFFYFPDAAQLPAKVNALVDLKLPFDIFPSANFVMTWAEEHVNGPVAEYLDWLATYDIADEIKADQQEGITLMTVHCAKGLEFPVVIIAGANEGFFPSKQAIANDEIEAERRLFYVAMTRAKDQLIITCRPEKTEKYGRIYESPISRFVGEAL